MKEIKIEKRTPEEMAAYFAEQLAKARAEGAEEAWGFVLSTDDWDEDMRCYDTYAEAKTEYEKWKAAQKWEPKVGDVVSQSNGLRGIVAYMSEWTADRCRCAVE